MSALEWVVANCKKRNSRLEIEVGPESFESSLFVDGDLELIHLSIDPSEAFRILRVL